MFISDSQNFPCELYKQPIFGCTRQACTRQRSIDQLIRTFIGCPVWLSASGYRALIQTRVHGQEISFINTRKGGTIKMNVILCNVLLIRLLKIHEQYITKIYMYRDISNIVATET
ncbi:hypothetical protein T265_05408 [Opisthorchis viverrini]|uniref:Uncharacterized protein n=1 Tax=Opisthorchis viverrini TaxID=6198 RepID=A0A074ZP53_OPIVI|nr:hypothetical protein T265_05408 [Opisthorchis viverrini]KER27592.1 hypothetical protein T265_05408 [Opisthorchis viverrini]